MSTKTECATFLPDAIGTREETNAFKTARLLWNKRSVLMKASVIGLVSFTILAFIVPKRYESTVRVMPPGDQTTTPMALMAAMSTNPGLGGLASDFLGTKNSSELLIGVIRSRTVEDRLVDRFDLRTHYRCRLRMDARLALESHTFASIDTKNGMVSIIFQDWDPRFAALVAAAYVEELNRTLAEVSSSSARRERIFLEGRLQDVKIELESAEKDFSEFASQNTAVDIPQQVKAMVEAAATLQGELVAAQSELKALEQVYTENNVRVRAARARASELRSQTEKLGGSPDEHVGSAEMYPPIRKLPLLGVRYADLLRRTKIADVVYESLTRQYELAKVQEAKETQIANVLDSADIPERKVFPHRIIIMGVGTILTLVLAMTWIVGTKLWERIDDDEPWKQLANEVLTALVLALRNALKGFGLARPPDAPPGKEIRFPTPPLDR